MVTPTVAYSLTGLSPSSDLQWPLHPTPMIVAIFYHLDHHKHVIIINLLFCFYQLTKVWFSVLLGVWMMVFPLYWRPRSQRHPLPTGSFTFTEEMHHSFFSRLKYLFFWWSTCVLAVYPWMKTVRLESNISFSWKVMSAYQSGCTLHLSPPKCSVTKNE